MYELIILGFLMRMPMHGYLITKIINDIIGPYAKFSSGRLYPLLDKLERDGLIENVTPAPDKKESGKRVQRTFRITEAGERRFFELMMDTTSNLGDYQKMFWQKYSFFAQLEPQQRLYLIDHYIHYCRTHLFHDEQKVEGQKQYEGNEVRDDDWQRIQVVVKHYKQQWELELQEVMKLRELENPS